MSIYIWNLQLIKYKNVVFQVRAIFINFYHHHYFELCFLGGGSPPQPPALLVSSLVRSLVTTFSKPLLPIKGCNWWVANYTLLRIIYARCCPDALSLQAELTEPHSGCAELIVNLRLFFLLVDNRLIIFEDIHLFSRLIKYWMV